MPCLYKKASGFETRPYDMVTSGARAWHAVPLQPLPLLLLLLMSASTCRGIFFSA